MSLVSRLLCQPIASNSDRAYGEAMRQGADLIMKMREYSTSSDAARAVMADIWSQHHNIPFMTTVYEAVKEMKDASTQKPEEPEPK